MDQETRNQINLELEHGWAAHKQGLEGRARVHARRAAGIAARIFLHTQGSNITISAYDALRQVAALSTVSARVRQAARALTLRVDETFQLPAHLNLLEEAQILIEELLPEY
ncbi:hypothetical protein ATHL_00915 [Anaerolinea thermolimosa]|uniref:hypothetical protein n=1 Tax=Anaerolinea thermolimosa TaxID=229919 RepID=UPI000785C011|nr:hypothetical protein [Anaerolinea thermolimosa]GAP06069.1 hypothetical protein ATHL_00915 [Anaerolinea thermolimosa]